jgi:hypothetical protein
MNIMSMLVFFCYRAMSLKVFVVVEIISMFTIVVYTFYIKCTCKRNVIVYHPVALFT